VIVVTAASLLSALRSRSEGFASRVALAGSWGVVVAGCFWYIQRVFFPGGI